MTTNSDEILRNVQSRKAAESFLELAADVPESVNERFWETLAVAASQRVGLAVYRPCPIEARGPMADEEAIAFERTIVPMGKYQGERVGDVPHAYWLYITESDFNRQLVRYIKSDYFQRRQDKEA
jgi:hypothetical protein